MGMKNWPEIDTVSFGKEWSFMNGIEAEEHVTRENKNPVTEKYNTGNGEIQDERWFLMWLIEESKDDGAINEEQYLLLKAKIQHGWTSLESIRAELNLYRDRNMETRISEIE